MKRIYNYSDKKIEGVTSANLLKTEQAWSNVDIAIFNDKDKSCDLYKAYGNRATTVSEFMGASDANIDSVDSGTKSSTKPKSKTAK